jgi:hypothetical protein
MALRSNPSVLVNPGYSDYHWGLIAASGAAAVEEEAFCVMTPLDDL